MSSKLKLRGETSKSLRDYKHFHLFSHIIDDYDIRINNKLIVERIINPRRDKVIMGSLVHVPSKYFSKKKKSLPSL
jgi:hypothetical protein